ncbi:hypothetical protein Tco_0098016 [Tanacetum coccineum]
MTEDGKLKIDSMIVMSLVSVRCRSKTLYIKRSFRSLWQKPNLQNTVKDRIMDSGASFHATYCKEELERFKLRSGKVRLAYDKTLDIAVVRDAVLKTSFGYHVGFRDKASTRLLKVVWCAHGKNKRGNFVSWLRGFGEAEEAFFHNVREDKETTKTAAGVGIVMLKMVSKTPLQFGVAERLSRTFRAKSTGLRAEASNMLWADSVSTAYLIYHIPYVSIGLRIPEEEWRGKDTSLAHLKVFGCDSFVKVKDVSGEENMKELSYVGALNDTSTHHKIKGFQLAGQEENLECILKEILYGLIQAPRLRYLKFDSFMQKDKAPTWQSSTSLSDSWNEEPCRDVHHVGEEREVKVLRTFSWPPSELIMEDDVLSEREVIPSLMMLVQDTFLEYGRVDLARVMQLHGIVQFGTSLSSLAQSLIISFGLITWMHDYPSRGLHVIFFESLVISAFTFRKPCLYSLFVRAVCAGAIYRIELFEDNLTDVDVIGSDIYGWEGFFVRGNKAFVLDDAFHGCHVYGPYCEVASTVKSCKNVEGSDRKSSDEVPQSSDQMEVVEDATGGRGRMFGNNDRVGENSRWLSLYHKSGGFKDLWAYRCSNVLNMVKGLGTDGKPDPCSISEFNGHGQGQQEHNWEGRLTLIVFRSKYVSDRDTTSLPVAWPPVQSGTGFFMPRRVQEHNMRVPSDANMVSANMFRQGTPQMSQQIGCFGTPMNPFFPTFGSQNAGLPVARPPIHMGMSSNADMAVEGSVDRKNCGPDSGSTTEDS